MIKGFGVVGIEIGTLRKEEISERRRGGMRLGDEADQLFRRGRAESEMGPGGEQPAPPGIQVVLEVGAG